MIHHSRFTTITPRGLRCVSRPSIPVVLATLAVFFLPVGPSFAGLLSELSASDQSAVKKGDQISIQQEVKGKPWPRMKIYRLINATSEEVAAVFCDYDGAKTYIPNLLNSTISKRHSPTTVEIDYELNVPILPDEFYTTKNTLTMPSPGVYRIDWRLLRAVQTKDSIGNLRVEPFGDRAIICYENLVTPGSSMAVLLKGTAIKQMNQTVAAIARQVETQKKTNPAGLAKEVSALRKALAGPSS